MSWKVLLIVALASPSGLLAGDAVGQTGSDTNKERFLLDDAEDAAAWYNGSPDETTISTSPVHVKQGRFSLKFANVVDHTKGEKNYPVGWPRVGKDLARAKRTDWSGYDFFECWIYAQTSRKSLPSAPLGVNFYHSGHKQSTHRPLKEVTKDAWVKIVVPVAELAAPGDVQRVQFNISEADYKHGDRVDFYIDDMVLTRFVTPVVAELALDRKILYCNDSGLTAIYKLAGRQRMEEVTVEFAVGRGDADPLARTQVKAARHGELLLTFNRALTAGTYWGRLSLRDAAGRQIDQKTVEFRAVEGPF